MIAYKCDRCNSYFDGTDYRMVKITTANGGRDTRFLDDIWLCDHCVNGLLSYLDYSETEPEVEPV